MNFLSIRGMILMERFISIPFAAHNELIRDGNPKPFL